MEKCQISKSRGASPPVPAPMVVAAVFENSKKLKGVYFVTEATTVIF